MKEIRTIIAKYESLKLSGIKMALAVVVNVEHSSYRRSGARMLITEDGTWVGGISGGCLEGDTLKKAQYAIHKGETVKVTYDTRDDDPNQIGVGLGCNGLIDVLIVPINNDSNNPIEYLKKIVDRRYPSILITDLDTGKVSESNDVNSRNKGFLRAIQDVNDKQRSMKICLDKHYFIEFLPPEINVFIFGKNYDVIPLAEIAKTVGYGVYVIENPARISKDIYQLADMVGTADLISKMDAYSVALVMSHDYNKDKNNLVLLQDKPIKYIGILGPKKRKEKMLSALKDDNIYITTENLYGPMGLDTGATTPEEIAISIIAEIRSVLSLRKGESLRNRIGSIHS